MTQLKDRVVILYENIVFSVSKRRSLGDERLKNDWITKEYDMGDTMNLRNVFFFLVASVLPCVEHPSSFHLLC